jgi:hypothetical protein
MGALAVTVKGLQPRSSPACTPSSACQTNAGNSTSYQTPPIELDAELTFVLQARVPARCEIIVRKKIDSDGAVVEDSQSTPAGNHSLLFIGRPGQRSRRACWPRCERDREGIGRVRVGSAGSARSMRTIACTAACRPGRPATLLLTAAGEVERRARPARARPARPPPAPGRSQVPTPARLPTNCSRIDFRGPYSAISGDGIVQLQQPALDRFFTRVRTAPHAS